MTGTVTDPDYRLDDQVGFLLRLANQRHVALFQAMQPMDLTPTQFAALMRLAELGQSSQNLLGRRTGMDSATIKGVVDRLVLRGLVCHDDDPDDRRRTVLRLTSGGQSVADELSGIGLAVTEATLAPLCPAERATFLGLLAKLT